MSARETAIAALAARITASLAVRNPAPTIGRNTSIPQALPAGGLVVLRDGETTNQQAILSPLSYAIEHAAEIEVVARTQALLDALLVDLAAAVLADRTLGGAVEWAEPGSATFDDVTFEGAAPARSASLPITLFYTVAGSPLA
jgi:hypothetical protein